MPWWTLKYKTRWLADGSIRSGNPVHTNFLWNELGRGTDLVALEEWLDAEQRKVDELTVAVFASQPPRWTDFFDASTLDAAAARRGEAIFEERCARCHGSYAKDWDSADPFATVSVDYHRQTPVFDVGTDPLRAQGMEHLADSLNGLAISQSLATVVVPQAGYVPPPLDAIWARYPYLHNNSVPSLCALLELPAERPAVFVQGPSEEPADYDDRFLVYPVGDAIPDAWWAQEDATFDTALPGLSNGGHADMLVDANGEPVLDAGAKADLLEFLKTL
jgi:mono/diheme cytochrome c family protein